MGRRSSVVGRRSWVPSRGSWVPSRGSWVIDWKGSALALARGRFLERVT